MAPNAQFDEPADSGHRSGPILRAEHLSRVAGDAVLVDDVSLVVERGEVVAIVGSSGAGKSSLLRLLNRLDEPTGGTVYLEGVDYRDIPPPALRQRVGMLLQRPYLFPGRVAQNLAYGPAAHGRALPRERMEELMEQVGLTGYLDREVKGLSGGEAQRVALARTLANDPEVLLLDEPTSGLDERAQLGVEKLVCGIMEDRGLTCVIVTHDQKQAARMAQRALVLEGGRVVRSGPATELVNA